jgi:hypothetical protein
VFIIVAKILFHAAGGIKVFAMAMNEDANFQLAYYPQKKAPQNY